MGLNLNRSAEILSAPPLQDQILARVDSLSHLPTTPTVALKFIELGNDPEVDHGDYAAVISADASLSAELLKLANSPWFGIRNKVTSIKNAVKLLGLPAIRTLAISHCLTGVYSELRIDRTESKAFWQVALCKAVAAKQFASQWDDGPSEEAFLAGMLQDLAIPVMYAVAKEQQIAILLDPANDWRTQLRRERAAFQMDHTEVGHLLAERLRLPAPFADAISFHHNYDGLGDLVARDGLRDAVYAASLFPHALVHWNRKDADEFGGFLHEHTQPTPVEIGTFLAGVQTEFDQLFGYFEDGQPPEARLPELFTATD